MVVHHWKRCTDKLQCEAGKRAANLGPRHQKSWLHIPIQTIKYQKDQFLMSKKKQFLNIIVTNLITL